MKVEEVIETRNHMFNLFLAVSPEIFIINATFILLIHGVVFSTSKKDDYPPLYFQRTFPPSSAASLPAKSGRVVKSLTTINLFL